MCVTQGNKVFPFVLGYVILHSLFFSKHPQKIFTLIFLCTAIGYCVDTALTSFKIMHFAGQTHFFPPLWFLGIWLLFTTTLQFSLRWLGSWSTWQLSLSSGLFAMVSYYVGSKLSGMQLQQPLWWSLGLIAIEWSILYPLFVKITKRILCNK